MKYYLGDIHNSAVLEVNRGSKGELELIFFNKDIGSIPKSLANLKGEVAKHLSELEEVANRSHSIAIFDVPFHYGELRFLDYILKENVVPATLLPINLDCYSCRVDITETRCVYFTSITNFYVIPVDAILEQLKNNLSAVNPEPHIEILGKSIFLSTSSQQYLFYTLALLEGYAREELNKYIDQFNIDVGDLRYWVSRNQQLIFLQAFHDRDYLDNDLSRCVEHLNCFFGMFLKKDKLQSELQKFLYTYTEGNFELFSILIAERWGIARKPAPAPRSCALSYAFRLSTRLRDLLKSVISDETRALVKSLDYFIN